MKANIYLTKIGNGIKTNVKAFHQILVKIGGLYY